MLELDVPENPYGYDSESPIGDDTYGRKEISDFAVNAWITRAVGLAPECGNGMAHVHDPYGSSETGGNGKADNDKEDVPVDQAGARDTYQCHADTAFGRNSRGAVEDLGDKIVLMGAGFSGLFWTQVGRELLTLVPREIVCSDSSAEW